MRRIIATALVGAIVLGAAGVAFAAGIPEIDEANAAIKLQPSSPFTARACLGEDGIKYVTYRGTWTGAETDLTPGSTDYNLSGPMTVRNIVWTINLTTQRGVLKGAANVSEATPIAVVPVYSGPLTLITQGLPSTAGTPVNGRGSIYASTYTSGKLDGGSL
ncbi:MAG TPA: hypothetical protein VGS21_04430, partial [Acidimicrobiales bacterium]|nr:hypothetical protein [Acidimicrobiales bacterium]